MTGKYEVYRSVMADGWWVDAPEDDEFTAPNEYVFPTPFPTQQDAMDALNAHLRRTVQRNIVRMANKTMNAANAVLRRPTTIEDEAESKWADEARAEEQERREAEWHEVV